MKPSENNWDKSESSPFNHLSDKEEKNLNWQVQKKQT